VLETLITSKTRIKMLLRFFINSNATAYLRGLAEEFGESTNSIRHELNNLSRAGYLTSAEDGRTIVYRANTQHPLYQDLKNLVHKYLGIDKIIENIVTKLGDVKAAYIVGDYAIGRDSGTIELLLVGNVDDVYLSRVVEKARNLIHRDITAGIQSEAEFDANRHQHKHMLLLWSSH
jgi:hypothetical protein